MDMNNLNSKPIQENKKSTQAMMASEMIDILQKSLDLHGDSEIVFVVDFNSQKVKTTKEIGIMGTDSVDSGITKAVTLIGPIEHIYPLAESIIGKEGVKKALDEN